jgi:hypothetical protein
LNICPFRRGVIATSLGFFLVIASAPDTRSNLKSTLIKDLCIYYDERLRRFIPVDPDKGMFA